VDEGVRNDEARVEPSAGYRVFGERVAGVLEAAEQAAEKIKDDARLLRRKARSTAATATSSRP
jgi:hypothetical protein